MNRATPEQYFDMFGNSIQANESRPAITGMSVAAPPQYYSNQQLIYFVIAVIVIIVIFCILLYLITRQKDKRGD